MPFINYHVETEIEFQRIVSALESAQIPYTYKKFADVAFPAVNQSRAYAEISVSDAYRDRIEVLFREVLSHGPTVSKSSSASKIQVGRLIWIVYTVLATLFLLKYWYINQQNSGDKNFSYEWSYDNTNLY